MKRTIAFLFVLLAFASCDVVKQVQQVTSFAKCDFKLNDVQDIRLAGVSVQNKNGSADLNLGDGIRLTAALTSGGPLDLTFNLNVQAHNPNGQTAGLNRLEWILLIDDIEMVNGINETPFTIPSNGSVVIPLSMNIDLRKALSGKSGQAMMNFAFNLAGANGVPTRIKLKAKPTILVGKYPVSYPGYITITSEVK
jgi:hypothetical protein